MIDRKYGMFLHFGMNTYLNVEWSDGTALASTYAPPADMAEKALPDRRIIGIDESENAHFVERNNTSGHCSFIPLS